MLFGPLPVSAALTVCAAGFGAWLERTVVRLAAGFAVADVCFCAVRFLGASTCTGGSVVGVVFCARAKAGTNTDSERQKDPA